jgi:hypothetical protein
LLNLSLFIINQYHLYQKNFIFFLSAAASESATKQQATQVPLTMVRILAEWDNHPELSQTGTPSASQGEGEVALG